MWAINERKLRSSNEEWEGINRQPRVPVVIDGFAYPMPVAALNKKINAAYVEWAEAETDWMAAIEDLNDAKAADALDFTHSVVNGLPDPGDGASPIAERKVKAVQILLDVHRNAVNRTGRLVADSMCEHVSEIVLEAIARARAGLQAQTDLMQQAASIAAEAHNARNRGVQGLREIAPYVRSVYQYDNSFPVTGFASFPNTSEERVNKILSDLEFLIDSGALFGAKDDDADEQETVA